MTIVGKISIGVVVVASAVFAVGLYVVSSLMDDFGACKLTILSSIPSPGGKTELVTFSRECNATVPFNTQMSITSNAHPFSPEQSPPFFVALQRPSITAGWVSDDIVEVSVPAEATVLRHETRVGNVRIEYR